MKQLFAFAFFLITVAAAASAQDVKSKPPAGDNIAVTDTVARNATEKLVAKYTLNADQAKEMYTIQQRKQRNLAEIEAYKTSNRSLWLSKMESLQKGTLNSIRRVLRTKEQVALYQKTQVEMRTKRADKRRELALAKAPKEDIQLALLEIYEE